MFQLELTATPLDTRAGFAPSPFAFFRSLREPNGDTRNAAELGGEFEARSSICVARNASRVFTIAMDIEYGFVPPGWRSTLGVSVRLAKPCGGRPRVVRLGDLTLDRQGGDAASIGFTEAPVTR